MPSFSKNTEKLETTWDFKRVQLENVLVVSQKVKHNTEIPKDLAISLKLNENTNLHKDLHIYEC